eukprot:scaffold967_cov321-Pavlova_lutheri.AAC.7
MNPASPDPGRRNSHSGAVGEHRQNQSRRMAHVCARMAHVRHLARREKMRGKKGRSILVRSGGQQLDLTEDNVRLVLKDARTELLQLFDESVGITGEVELADMDGPFVKLALKGRFWHRRSDVVARVGNYLQKRIPEIVEVEAEEEGMLDDSPENF